MKISKSFLLLVMAVLILLCIYVGWNVWKAYPMAYNNNAKVLVSSLKYYLIQNEGQFPRSEEDLISKGFFRRDKTIELKCLDTSQEVTWCRCARFKAFRLHYGVSSNTLKAKDNRLIDTTTDKEVFLITGPFMWLLPYRQYSLDLYDVMKDY